MSAVEGSSNDLACSLMLKQPNQSLKSPAPQALRQCTSLFKPNPPPFLRACTPAPVSPRTASCQMSMLLLVAVRQPPCHLPQQLSLSLPPAVVVLCVGVYVCVLRVGRETGWRQHVRGAVFVCVVARCRPIWTLINQVHTHAHHVFTSSTAALSLVRQVSLLKERNLSPSLYTYRGEDCLGCVVSRVPGPALPCAKVQHNSIHLICVWW